MVDFVLIPRRSLIKELGSAVPEFVPDPEWVKDDLEYVVVCDFARYICGRASSGDWDAVKRGIDFLESFLGQDSQSHGLVLEGLESLATCGEIEGIKRYFGPKVSALWNSLGGSS